MSLDTLVNTPGEPVKAEQYAKDNQDNSSALTSWVMGHVDRWRQFRDSNYLDDWNKYYNLWRGKWTVNLKNKDAERSRLIAPALQQAVDQTLAEEVEAIFGREAWVDIQDDVRSNNFQEAAQLRDQLLEDFDKAKVPRAVREALLNGCLFGTGIMKAGVAETTEYTIEQDGYGGAQATPNDKKRFLVSWQAVPPDNFVIDPAALDIESAMGCAHETVVPRHIIYAKQRDKTYKEGAIGGMSGMRQTLGYRPERGEIKDINSDDGVYITEYHGLVPQRLLTDNNAGDSTHAAAQEEVDSTRYEDNEEMVEAIVTIANGGILLRANANPILKKDRAFAAFAHDKVPNRFWGRGVCEKGFNSQLALDAELRARIDALGLLTYPVMGADATRLPRNLNLNIVPGKTFLTNGPPNEVLQPITFGNLNPATFQQSGDLERMVQMATGAADSATPVDINSKNQTASGISMQSGAVIKRAKLTMQNVDEFLDAVVRKSLLRYMQFDAERYPKDLDFTVCSTMSIMAKEFEQTQMTNLLAIIPQESPAFLIVLKGIVENYSGPSKGQILGAIDQMLKPDPQQQKLQQMQSQMNLQMMQAQLQKEQTEIKKLEADIAKIAAQTQNEQMDTRLMPVETQAKVAAVVIQDKQQSHQTLIDAHRAASDRIKANKPASTSSGSK